MRPPARALTRLRSVRAAIAGVLSTAVACGDNAAVRADLADASRPLDAARCMAPLQDAACGDDAMSPNGAPDAARQLELAPAADPTYVEDLRVCAGSDDWYAFELTAGLDVQFGACSDDVAPVELAFYRDEFPESEWYFTGPQPNQGGETCRHTGVWSAPGRYLFRVSTQEPCTTYRLQIFHTPLLSESCALPDGEACDIAATCLGGRCACNADAAEPNDEPADATLLELDVSRELLACFSDDDWFAFEAEPGRTVTIELGAQPFLAPAYRMSVEVFEPGAAVATAFFPKLLAQEQFAFTPTVSGRHHLRVRNVWQHAIDYTLRVR